MNLSELEEQYCMRNMLIIHCHWRIVSVMSMNFDWQVSMAVLDQVMQPTLLWKNARTGCKILI